MDKREGDAYVRGYADGIALAVREAKRRNGKKVCGDCGKTDNWLGFHLCNQPRNE